MKKTYILSFIFLGLISATFVNYEANYWNFKDYKAIEYDITMKIVNHVSVLNQKNGIKATGELVLNIIDSSNAKLSIVNKKIVESISDSITSFNEVDLDDEVLYENYSRKGEITGEISKNAISLKKILFPIMNYELHDGDSINIETNISFDIENEIIQLKGENRVTKASTIKGVETYFSKLNSPKFSVENPHVKNMEIYFDGDTNFQFDKNKGIYLNEKINLNFHILREIEQGKIIEMMVFSISQDIKLKNLEKSTTYNKGYEQ